MKKLVIGMVIGFFLSVPFSLQAEEIKNMIGKQVQGVFPVKHNGQYFDEPAVVIDGRTYYPIRYLAEKLGHDVGFDPGKGEVTLSAKGKLPESSKPIQSPVSEPEQAQEASNHDLERTMESIDQMIKNAELRVQVQQTSLDRALKRKNENPELYTEEKMNILYQGLEQAKAQLEYWKDIKVQKEAQQ